MSALYFKRLLLHGGSQGLCAYNFPVSSPAERDCSLLESWQEAQFPWFWKGPISMAKPVMWSISMWSSKWFAVGPVMGGESVSAPKPWTKRKRWFPKEIMGTATTDVNLAFLVTLQSSGGDREIKHWFQFIVKEICLSHVALLRVKMESKDSRKASWRRSRLS